MSLLTVIMIFRVITADAMRISQSAMKKEPHLKKTIHNWRHSVLANAVQNCRTQRINSVPSEKANSPSISTPEKLHAHSKQEGEKRKFQLVWMLDLSIRNWQVAKQEQPQCIEI